MKISSSPKEEKKRLQALYNGKLLDTEAEKLFDDLIGLVRKIYGTPFALLNLIDLTGYKWRRCFLTTQKTTCNCSAYLFYFASKNG